MKIIDVVQSVSELYRNERGIESDLHNQIVSVRRRLSDAEAKGWGDMSVSEYNDLNNTLKVLSAEMNYQRKYCDGIAAAREILMDLGMDLGFDTEIDDATL